MPISKPIILARGNMQTGHTESSSSLEGKEASIPPSGTQPEIWTRIGLPKKIMDALTRGRRINLHQDKQQMSVVHVRLHAGGACKERNITRLRVCCSHTPHHGSKINEEVSLFCKINQKVSPFVCITFKCLPPNYQRHFCT
jgi:hypothetical protein